MANPTWTDRFGRSYPYEPYSARPIAELEMSLSGDAGLALAEASRRLGEVPALPLAGIAAVLYRSESSASSLIEGLAAAPRRVLEAEFAEESEIHDEIGTRIIKNLHGLRDAISTPGPPKSDDLLRWHQILTAGHPLMRPSEVGAYRTEQNWIGGDASGPRHASFIPPAPGDVPGLIADLEDFCARSDIAPLQQALVAHGRFEVIHPFVDGNGRVGRMLLQHLIVQRIGLASPIPISIPWSREPDRYIAGLRSFQDGDMNGWIEFAAGTVVEAVAWMTGAADTIETLLAGLRTRSHTRGSSVAAQIIDDLPTFPLIDANSVAERYEVSIQTAHGALGRLEERGILSRRAFAKRTKSRGRPRQVFTSLELLEALSQLLAA